MPNQYPRNDPDSLLQWVENDVTEYELSSQRAKLFHSVASLLHSQDREAEAQQAEWRGLLFDFMLVPRSRRQSLGGERFVPMIQAGDCAYPHVSMLPPESLVYFLSEARRSHNPIHRALYADFVWDQRRRYPGPKEEGFTAATIAIDAYLHAAGQYRKNQWDDQLADALDRASELALVTGDANLIERCKTECFQIADELVTAQRLPDVRWAFDVLLTLLGFKRRQLFRPDLVRAVALSEAGAAFYESIADHYWRRSFLWLAAQGHRINKNPGAERRALARRAGSFLDEAAKPGSAIVRLLLLEKALVAYQRIGDTASVNEIKIRLGKVGRDVRSEMTTVTVRGRVSPDLVEGLVSDLLASDLDDALALLAMPTGLIPETEPIPAQAEQYRHQFPTSHLANRRMLDSAGRIVARATDDDQHVVASEAGVYNVALWTGRWETGLAFDQLELRKGLTSETFMRFLRTCPIFDADTLGVVETGVERYFASDYVSAVHVLVPQLEDTFRDVLARLGVSRTSVTHSISRERPLDEVLMTPELRSRLGEDLATFFEHFLILPDFNLRNRTAHGLLKVGDCTRQTTQRLLLCYLYLGNVIVPDEVEPDGHR